MILVGWLLILTVLEFYAGFINHSSILDSGSPLTRGISLFFLAGLAFFLFLVLRRRRGCWARSCREAPVERWPLG